MADKSKFLQTDGVAFIFELMYNGDTVVETSQGDDSDLTLADALNLICQEGNINLTFVQKSEYEDSATVAEPTPVEGGSSGK